MLGANEFGRREQLVDGIVEFVTAQLDREAKRLRDGWYGDVYWQALDNAAALGGWTAARQLGITVRECDLIAGAAMALIKERLQGWQQQEAEPRLADIAAKRRILERHSGFDFPATPDDGPGDFAWTARCDEHCPGETWPCADLRDLAALYAGQPGYKEDWRP